MKHKLRRTIAAFTAAIITASALPLTVIPISAENETAIAAAEEITAESVGSGEYTEDGYLSVSSYKELYDACRAGKESKIRISGDITADSAITSEININCDTVIDLAGYNIKRDCKAQSYSENALFYLYKGNLTIEDSTGKGTVSVVANNLWQSMVRTEYGRKLTINGGNFTFEVSDKTFTADMFNIWGSDIEIYSGNFDVGQYSTPIALTPYSDGTRVVDSTCLMAGGVINCYASISVKSLKGAAYSSAVVMSGGTYNNMATADITLSDGSVANDRYFVRKEGTADINVTVIRGEIPARKNGVTITYSSYTGTEDWTLTGGAAGIKAFCKTYIGAYGCGFKMQDAYNVLGRDEIKRLKNGKLELKDREIYTVSSNSVGRLALYSTRKSGTTVNPVTNVVWQVSVNYGSWKTVASGQNFYTPPEVSGTGIAVYKATATYDGIEIENYFVVKYDFKVISSVSVYINNFRPHRTPDELEIISLYPDKYTASIDGSLLNQWNGGAKVDSDEELTVNAPYTIKLKITPKPGYVLAKTGLSVRLNAYTAIDDWHVADSVSGNIATFDWITVPYQLYYKNIDITMDALRIGRAAPTTLTSELPGYFRLWNIEWLDWQTDEEPSVIELGKEYACYIYLDCNGYEISSGTKITVNGTEAVISAGTDEDEDIDYICARVIFKAEKPAAPEFWVKSRTSDSVTISWNKQDDADGYAVSIYKDGKWVSKTADSDKTSLVINGLESATGYAFKIAGYIDADGKRIYGEYSENLTVKTLPSAPSNFTLGARTSDSISFRWDRDTKADGYILEMLDNGEWKIIETKTSNGCVSHKVTGLAPAQWYRFRLRSFAYENGRKLYSISNPVIAEMTAPQTVTGVTLGARTSSSVSLKWDKNETSSGCVVQMYENGKWVAKYTTKSPSAVSCKITGLSPATEYKFRICAYRVSGTKCVYGSFSEVFTATTAPEDMQGFKVAMTAKTAIRLNWSKNTSADGYIIEMVKDGKWEQTAKIIPNTVIAYAQTGLTADTAYRFRIRAFNISGTTIIYSNYAYVNARTAK